MSEMLSDPQQLRSHLDRLQEERKARGLDAAGAEALAEGSFRLAVHPSTPMGEAVKLLHRAYRLDGTNPKYAYFLARLYLLYGNFDRAAQWIQIAVRHCPTSHRIWVHVSLIQRELNARYSHNDKFEPDDLRKRAAEIATHVQQGRDYFDTRLLDFLPRPSRASKEAAARAEREATPAAKPQDHDQAMKPAALPDSSRRFINGGQCRWSGVHDLSIEEQLEGNPNEYARDYMLESLKYAARMAESRHLGVSGFAILAIEWCVCGYPVPTVRLLRGTLSRELTNPSLQLLDLVCDLFEAEPNPAAARIAQSLQDGSLSPLLGALIHHRHFLSAPLEFRALGKYRSARRFLAESYRTTPADDAARKKLADRALELARGIFQATESLQPKHRPPMANPVAKTEMVAPDTQSLLITLDSIESILKRLASTHDCALEFLEKRLGPQLTVSSAAATPAQQRFGQENLDRLRASFQTAAMLASDKLDGVLAASFSLNDQNLSTAFRPRAIACRRGLNDLLYGTALVQQLQAIGARLTSVPGAIATVPAAVAHELTELRDAVAAVTLTDQPATDQQPASPVERLAALAEEAEETKVLLATHWNRLKKLVDDKDKGPLGETDLADGAAIAHFIETTDQRGQQALKEIAAIRASGELTEKKDVAALDKAQREFQDLAGESGRFQKKLRRLSLPKAPPKKEADATVAGSPTNVLETTTPPAPASDPTGLAVLETALQNMEQQIDRMFAAANASFDCYPAATKALPAFRALRLSVGARQAETLYRLGRRRDARRIWNNLLREDRLDERLLKNIAVCDSNDRQDGREMNTWRAYLELLYSRDIAEGSLRSHARQRAEFHRDFGQAYAPNFLVPSSEKDESPSVNEESLLAFIDSPSRVKMFVEHKLLEWLNTKLDFTSPVLVLGCSRAEGEKARTEARDKLLEFGAMTASLLPVRVRAAFADSVKQNIESACEACASAQRLTREKDPHYPQEEVRQEQWVKDICGFKYRLLTMIGKSKELPKRMRSVDFLVQLARLDEAPLTLGPTFLNAVARHYRLAAEQAPMLQKLMDRLRFEVIHNLMRFLINDTDDSAEDSLRQCQYQRLIQDWVKQPLPAELLDLIDDPQPFYPEEVIDVLSNKKPDAAGAIAILRRWTQHYPELTGPARHLGPLLLRQNQVQEAIQVLEAAWRTGFHEKGRQECFQLLRSIKLKRAVESDDYEESLPVLLKELKTDDTQHHLARNVITVFIQQARGTGNSTNHRLMAEAINAWIGRARARLNSASQSEKQGEKAALELTSEQIDGVEDLLKTGLVQVFLAPFGELGPNADWKGIAQAMGELLAHYRDIPEGYYLRMIAHRNLAGAASLSHQQRDEVIRLLREALEDAEVVISRTANADHRQQAEKIREEIRGILDRI